MDYRVVLADSAKADAHSIYDRVVAAAPHRGPLWFEELLEYLYSLDHLPLRCPLAREAVRTGREIGCLLFGKRRNVYRILYEVDEPGRRFVSSTSGMALEEIWNPTRSPRHPALATDRHRNIQDEGSTDIRTAIAG